MSTEERLEMLERQMSAAKRRNRWMLAAVGLLLGGAIVWLAFRPGTAWAQPNVIRATPIRRALAAGRAPRSTRSAVPTVIRANQFILQDKGGKVRASLGSGKGGVSLDLFDQRGTARAILSVNKDGPSVNLLDERGKLCAILSVTNHRVGLSLADRNGKLRAWLAVGKNGSSLCLSDEKGNPIWDAP